ncbi:MAG: shikimate kinase AroK [Proteobacteria bacterium]|nr:shikimate kinase AroK [Pseudomonadota bacterium]
MRGDTVWLVGMMGAGKSTVGPVLARCLGRKFADSDAEIEREAGAQVSEIFTREGEAGFRERERAAVARLAHRGGVVALGGGAIAQEGLAEELAATGVVVYLAAAPETLLARTGDPESRPLLRGLAESDRVRRLEALQVEREAYYRTAAITVQTDGRDVDAIVEEIRDKLAKEQARKE